MWFSIIRFIGVNWIGLATGYTIRDISGAISGKDSNDSKPNEESFLTKIMRKIGIPGWFAPISALIVLLVLAYRFGAFKRKWKFSR